jgi:hypothetical protein
VVKYSSSGLQQPSPRPLTHEPRASLASPKQRPTTVDTTYFQRGGERSDFQRDTVLPSIEDPPFAAGSFHRRVVSGNQLSAPRINERQAIIANNDAERRVNDIEILDLTDDTQHITKRRRLDDTGAEILDIPRSGNVASNLFLEQRKPQYISLLSPPEKHSQPGDFYASAPSPPQLSHGHAKASSSRPLYRDNQAFHSPTNGSGERLVAHRRAGQLSGLSHFSSHEDLYPATSSSRLEDGSTLSRPPPSVTAGTTSVDAGIQQYRAFRARERQERAAPSLSSRARPQLYESDNLADSAIKSRSVQLEQPGRLVSSRDVSDNLPSKRLVQDFRTVDSSRPPAPEEAYRLTRERLAEPHHRLRRRSASPTQESRSRLRYVPVSPQPQSERQLERNSGYVSMDWEDHELERGAHFETVLVRPTQR